MASRDELLLEAESRGILPPDKQALLDEARVRGLVMSKEEYEVRSGTNQPDYMGKGFLPAGFVRFSDRVFDPFGVKDEIMGATQFVREYVKSGGDLEAGKAAYVKARDRDRAEQKVAHADYGIVPEIVGGIGAGGIIKNTIKAASLLPRIAQGAKAGAKFGAAAGFGHSEGGVGERIIGAGQGAAVGAVAAPLVSEVVLPALARTGVGLARAAQYGARAARGARNPEAQAIQNTADRMVAGGIDPAAVRARALTGEDGQPLLSHQLQARNFTEEQLADIVGRARAGEPHAAIAADHGISPQTVGNYARRYEAANPTPMNIMDQAVEMVGEGRAMPLKRFGRAAMSLADDEGAATASDRLLNRQLGQPGRSGQIIQRSVAGGDFEAARATGLTNLRNEADTAYRQFYAEPDLATNALDDLMADPLFKQATTQAQQQARVSAIRRNQQLERENAQARGNGQQEQPLEPVPYSPKNDPQHQALRMEREEAKDALTEARRRRQDATAPAEKRAALEESRVHEDTITAVDRQLAELSSGDTEVFSPQMLDNIQRQLRIASEGKLSNPTAAQHARDLREVFLDRIEQHYPTFRDIRRNYATGMGEFGEEGALEAGRQLTTRLGAKTSEALRGYADYTPAQQELFRLGFARRMMDMAADPVEGAAVANKFSTPAVREIVEHLYPHDTPLWRDGQRLLRQLRGEKITTDNKNFLMSGSQTAEKSSDMGRMTEGFQAAADFGMGRYGKILENAATRLTTQLGARGAGHAITLLTETEPARLLPLLNRLTAAARNTQARQAGELQLRALRRRGFERLAAPTAILLGHASAVEPAKKP